MKITHTPPPVRLRTPPVSARLMLLILGSAASPLLAQAGGRNAVGDGTYFVTNRHSSLAADVPDAAPQGAKIDQADKTDDNNQKWTLTNLGGNHVKLINAATGLAMEITGGSTSNGGAADQRPYSGASNQIWNMLPTGDGAYQIVNVASGLALEAPGWSTAPGTPLDQWSYGNGPHQQWNITATTITPIHVGKLAPILVTAPLVDPDATPAAQALYRFLKGHLGTQIISGQTDQDKFDYVTQTTGNTSLLRDYDMQPYSPQFSYAWSNTATNPKTGARGYFSFAPDPNNPNVANAIKWYRDHDGKPIIDFQWHWHSPMGGTVGTNTFDASNTTFDVSRAVVPGTRENAATLHDIDAIAKQLEKLNDAGVPILWRPLHEADGGGFWWDAKGPAAYVALWNLMYDRLVHHHQLHNLIWTWTGDNPQWYPGNNKVDILGIDSYPGNFDYEINKAAYKKIQAISGGNKILAMTENSPIPDVEKSLMNGAPWAFFMSWYDVTVGNDDAHLKSVYTDPHVITLQSRTD